MRKRSRQYAGFPQSYVQYTKKFKRGPIRRVQRTQDIIMQDKPRRPTNYRIGGFLGIEKKFIDTVKTATNISATWTGGEIDPAASALCCPVKGTGPSDRDGDHIMIKQILVKGSVSFRQQSDLNDCDGPYRFAIYLVQDRQTNGAQLNAEDVMVNTNPEDLSFRNLQYSKRFKILKKFLGSVVQTSAFLDGANTGSVSGSMRRFQWLVNCNIPVAFNGNAGTVADIVDNSLHIIACSEGTAPPQLAYHARCRFVG